MINFSLEKFRSSDPTETFRVKNSDNVLTKSRKLETKLSWIIRFRSFLNLKKPKNQGSRISISPYYIFTDLAALVSCNYYMCSQLVSLTRLTVGRGPLTVGGPGSLNLLNLPLLRHCVSTNQSSCELHLLSLEHINSYQILLFMFSFHNNLLPKSLLNTFALDIKKNSDFHSYNT